MKIVLPDNILSLLRFFLATLIILIFLFNSSKALGISTDSNVSNVFDDQLLPNWENWSWSSTVNLNEKESTFSGSYSIEFTPFAWGGLYLHTNKTLDISKYKTLQFAIRTTQTQKPFELLFYDVSNQIVKKISLSQYGDIQANVWKTYEINLGELSIGGNQINGIAFQEAAGSNQAKTYIDSIQFIPVVSDTNPTSSSMSKTSDSVIYQDLLSSGWENWSWSSNIKLDNPDAFAGQYSISFAPYDAWAGLFLQSNNQIDTASFSNLNFRLKASESNQKFSVILIDSGYQILRDPLPVDNYGGQPSKDVWNNYSIPLADLRAANQKIKGIIIQEALGKSQPTVYVDDIVLSSDNSSLAVIPSKISSPAPTISITPTPKASTSTTVGKFTTLPVGSVLPSTQECAQKVRRSSWEPRPENNTANHVIGRPLPNDMEGTSEEGQIKIKSRIDGNFTGTTDEIIQWGACKWGFDEENVRAVAAQESWWRQSTLGDWNGSDFESYGLLQVRRTAHVGTYPLSAESVPFNVDYALAWRRACYEGYFYWIPASAKGDEWGCIGLWFSGRWRDGDPNVAYSGANWYINKVQEYTSTKPWLKSDF